MSYPQPRVLALIVLLSLAAQVSSVQAEERRFQIDLIVFANNDSSAVYAEKWPDNLRLRYPKNWTALPGAGSSNNVITRVENPAPEFASVMKSIRLSSRYRTLFQASWQQSLVSRRGAPAIVIQGGKKEGDHRELEGYIKVAVERYLYLDTNLWLTSFGNGQGNYYLPQPPYRDQGEEPHYGDSVQTDYPLSNTSINRIVVMDQIRRLRSNEVHFLDHPLFGVLVMITNIDDLKP